VFPVRYSATGGASAVEKNLRKVKEEAVATGVAVRRVTWGNRRFIFYAQVAITERERERDIFLPTTTFHSINRYDYDTTVITQTEEQ
jgi:hypothetical protein